MKNLDSKEYDWAIVGGGVVGIFISEILTREGYSVVLIEKNEKLASETTREFHEWIHTGSLYTLIPDNLMTLKFLLGSIDDIIDYYASFKGMNLIPTEKGLKIRDDKLGWFNNNFIHFKFRIGKRKLLLPWLFGISRAIFLIDRIKEHDWLRKRAGILDPFKLKISVIFKIFIALLKHKGTFYDYRTPDFTTNSRNLLNEVLEAAKNNNLKVSVKNEFLGFEKNAEKITVNCKNESFIANRIVLTNGENISEYVDSRVKTSFAPMAVINNVSKETNSFVELDFYPKNCINILTKDDDVALIGGISFSNIDKCESYIEEVIEKHKKYNPKLKVLDKYIGKKSEVIINSKDNRNYLYHILNIDQNVWGIIPGKFTLAFSIAPEFFRRVYKKNPTKLNLNVPQILRSQTEMSNTVWHDVSKK
jgi:hypothetical protein